MSERDELERQISDLRDFEREYRSRLIAYHRDRLAELAGSAIEDRGAVERRVRRIAQLAKTNPAAALREERQLYLDVLALAVVADPVSAEMAVAALAAAQIDYPRGSDA